MSYTARTDLMVERAPIGIRTNAAFEQSCDLCRQLERELNAANERIRRLEEAGDELAGKHLFAVHTYDNAKKHVAEWYKAKEAKP